MPGELHQHHGTGRGQGPRPLHGGEGLAQHQEAQGGGGQRTGEGQEGHGQGGQALHPAEPQRVGDQGADHAEVGEAEEVGPGDPFGQALHQQGCGGQEEAARGQLPPGQGQDARAGGPPPPLGEHDAGRHAGRRGEPGQHPDRVQGGPRAQHQQGHARGAQQRGDHVHGADALAEEQRGQGQDQHGLHGHHQGGHPAGQQVGGDEEQVEEDADIERAQHRGAPPPRARGQGAGHGQQYQAGGQGAHGGGEQGPVGRQELGGDQVGAAPHGRGQRGDQGVRGQACAAHVSAVPCGAGWGRGTGSGTAAGRRMFIRCLSFR